MDNYEDDEYLTSDLPPPFEVRNHKFGSYKLSENFWHLGRSYE